MAADACESHTHAHAYAAAEMKKKSRRQGDGWVDTRRNVDKL